MFSPQAISIRITAATAVALMLVGTLQQSRVLCHVVGCDPCCAAADDVGALRVCAARDGHDCCCDSERDNAPQRQPTKPSPCDEGCWCAVAAQPFEGPSSQPTVDALFSVGATVAYLDDAPQPCVRPAQAADIPPPLTSLGRCVLLSRFLA
ncbi:hypothetical protein Pla175_25740 [Pirellulimonas nuda]|uniref:Uncharacterized protein n=1 Tax=Pirellulimonas nuda TaxID=2528009 RepID=A0A518DCH6_9BACT|nr:hypothetical protein [Pirellulimonas nuda]QDU89187.1 hypothetical protein Pla175_25740 [Pirellulimonas nuda]